MSKIEVCVATVDNDFSLIKKMNINCDICIANQCNKNGIEIEDINGHKAKLISTTTRGVGLNRNISLSLSSGDILMLADDDIVYHKGYERMIEQAFSIQPKADVIVFRMQFVRQGEVFEVDNFKRKKLHVYNGLSFGTYAIAIKRDAYLKANLSFTELFGGGATYSCGEDSLFLLDCFRKGLKVYSSDFLIGDNIREKSSWFTGYNEKYYYDKGAFIACAFPKLRFIMCLYFLFVYRKEKEVSFNRKVKLINAGIKGFDSVLSYKGWCKKDER